MNRIITLSLFSLLLFIAGFSSAQTSNSSSLIVKMPDKTYTFNSDIVSRKLISQKVLPPDATFGFFTDRNDSIPFYFSCVLANIASKEIIAGNFPVLAVVNDMPVVDSTIRQGGFIAIKRNDTTIAHPEEYTSIPGKGNMITIQQITPNEVKGIFNTAMQSVSDPGRKIAVSGSFVIKRN